MPYRQEVRDLLLGPNDKKQKLQAGFSGIVQVDLWKYRV